MNSLKKFTITIKTHIEISSIPTSHLFTVLAVVVALGSQDGEVQFGYVLGAHVGMSLGQMVDKHTAPLEAEKTRVALVDEAVVVVGRYFGDELLLRLAHLLTRLFGESDGF